jgi:cytochrome c-type biogenesis protein CcmF
VTVASTVMIVWRLPLLRALTKLESLVSREATFLYNNLLLVALCLTILWGVMFPLLSEAVKGERITVGKPYYNFFLHSFGLPLLLLMGIGPLVAWRRASLRALGKTFLWPLAAAVAAGGALLAAGGGSSRIGLIAYTFSVFVLASIVLEFVRGTLATGSFVRLVARNRRRYGGYVVHAAIVLLAIGVAGSSAYQTVRERALRPGQTMHVGRYDLFYRGATTARVGNHLELRANLAVRRGGDSLGVYSPGKNRYFAEQQVSNEPSIRHDLLTGEDLFMIVNQVDRDGTVHLKVLVKPLVNLIWLAGFIFLAGSLIAMWPDAREQRRFAERYATQAASA